MHTSGLDTVLTASAIVADVALCLVLLIRRRVGSYPALFSFIILDVVFTPVLYAAGRIGSGRTFGRFYLAYSIISFLVQLTILYEIAKHVLRPNERWTREALYRMFLTGILGALMALLATFLIQPEGRPSPDTNQLRADVFTGLLTCELVIAMMFASGRVGLGWRNHVMAIGQGLMVWALVSSTVEGAAAYLGPQSPYLNAFYLLRVFAYLGVVSYWCVSLWYEEPARKPISPAFRKYVLALHETVHYDLGKVGH